MRALEAPSSDVLSVGSSEKEFLLLCIREDGRERRRWPIGEWGAARWCLSSRPRSLSMLGPDIYVLMGGGQLSEFCCV